MAKNFKELQAKMPAEARARSEDEAGRMIREMALDELRGALDLTQQHLAELLHVNQAAISKVERRSDMYISTLRKIIEAMGGSWTFAPFFPTGLSASPSLKMFASPPAPDAISLASNPDRTLANFLRFLHMQFRPLARIL